MPPSGGRYAGRSSVIRKMSLPPYGVKVSPVGRVAARGTLVEWAPMTEMSARGTFATVGDALRFAAA